MSADILPVQEHDVRPVLQRHRLPGSHVVLIDGAIVWALTLGGNDGMFMEHTLIDSIRRIPYFWDGLVLVVESHKSVVLAGFGNAKVIVHPLGGVVVWGMRVMGISFPAVPSDFVELEKLAAVHMLPWIEFACDLLAFQDGQVVEVRVHGVLRKETTCRSLPGDLVIRESSIVLVDWLRLLDVDGYQVG